MKVIINRITDRISGAEIYNLYLLKSLRKFDDLEIVFSSNNEELNKKVKDLNYVVMPIYPVIHEIGTKKQLVFSLVKLPKYLYSYFNFFYKTNDSDIIIFESMTEKIFLTFMLKVWKKKVIWIEHGPLFATKKASLIKALYKLNSYFVSKIICVSQSTQYDLVTAGLNKQKTIVLYIGVDTKELEPLSAKKSYRTRCRLGLLKKETIGFLGTVNREKGIKAFIEAATVFSKIKSNAYFIVIGGGDLLHWAKNEVQQKGIGDRFYFTGFVDNVREYLGILDVLLFPSSHLEGLSISLLEANSMGIPCIVTDIGGNNEIIFNNKNGLLYSNSSPSKVASMLEEVFANEKKYKTYARKVALEKFSLEKNGNDFYRLFESIYYEK